MLQSRLEELLDEKETAEKELKVLNEELSHIEKEIENKKLLCWEQMFSDFQRLKKYTDLLDTGIQLKSEYAETLGFNISGENPKVVSILHSLSQKPKERTEFFYIYKNKPFDVCNQDKSHWMEYVLKAGQNWDTVLNEIEKNIEKELIDSINKTKKELKEKQKLKLQFYTKDKF